MPATVDVVLYEDPLSPWCALAEARIAAAADALGVEVALRHAPFPLAPGSVRVLAALAAAREQGPAREAALRRVLREATLERGLETASAEVLVELAELAGLDRARFTEALGRPSTERAVLATWRTARCRGIGAAPALVIGEAWLVSGTRSADEYAEILQRWLARAPSLPPERTLH
ncbi:MAG: DsbA family protein [Anaeromyxobacteraceae bacterium]